VRLGKVVPALFFLNWAPRYDGELGEWIYSSKHSLASTLDRGEWWASRPGRFTPTERAPATRWIRGWGGGDRAGQAAVVRRKIPSPYRDSNPRSALYHWATPATIDEIYLTNSDFFFSFCVFKNTSKVTARILRLQLSHIGVIHFIWIAWT
jgi:hypothetical protein